MASSTDAAGLHPVRLDSLLVRPHVELDEAPERGEILFGLFARLTRLFCVMCEDANLWTRDLGGIMLRCLADTAITFAYLASKGTDLNFERFREYGEGQEKLLMLHLRDNYPDDVSVEGRESDQIAEGMASFAPELINIELGSWSKKHTRRLADECGMDRFYRLVFAPTSGDVHGSWMSLKNSNFERCGEILHRFHRVPSYVDPPVYVDTMKVALEIFSHCLGIAMQCLGYPALPEPLDELGSSLASEEDSDS